MRHVQTRSEKQILVLAHAPMRPRQSTRLPTHPDPEGVLTTLSKENVLGNFLDTTPHLRHIARGTAGPGSGMEEEKNTPMESLAFVLLIPVSNLGCCRFVLHRFNPISLTPTQTTRPKAIHWYALVPVRIKPGPLQTAAKKG